MFRRSQTAVRSPQNLGAIKGENSLTKNLNKPTRILLTVASRYKRRKT